MARFFSSRGEALPLVGAPPRHDYYLFCNQTPHTDRAMAQPHARDLRKGRVSERDHTYLITTVTHQRVPWFHDLRAARALVQVPHSESRHAQTLAFVVMPDHLHWLMRLAGTASLAAVMQGVKSVSSHRINRLLTHRGPLWQAGFHDHVLRREEDLMATARYVVGNPQRAGLVQSIGDYPHWDAIWL
jgi:putative transposase